MNPFLDPRIALPFLHHYFTDSQRIERMSPHRLERYRDKALKKILSYAATVPLYQKAYQYQGIDLSRIKGISSIDHLPFISKQDLRDNFPDRIIPKGYNKDKAFIVGTGGTTGEPVSIFTDFPTMLRGTAPGIRELNHFSLHWKKSRIVHLGNFNAYRIDSVFRDNMMKHVQSFTRLDNILNIDVDKPIKQIMERLDSFKPDLIISYPAIFQHLAYLKRKGLGQHIQPKLLQVGGAMLDEYTREYVEDAFDCPLLNIYPSVEAQANIAFECEDHSLHIHSDFFQVEAINEKDELVNPGERGHIVLTRLWGKGTPIVRYTGMNDWVILADETHRCSCGLHSPVFAAPIEGRMRATIILPNGKVFPPGAFCFIAPVLHNLHTYKVKRYQIIQKSLKNIEILLVIDDDMRDQGPSFEKIAEEIIKVYQQKTGPEMKITVKEVKEIPKDPRSGKPAPIVVSLVTPAKAEQVFD